MRNWRRRSSIAPRRWSGAGSSARPTLISAPPRAAARSARVFAGDVGRGLLEISHNTLAVVGLATTFVATCALHLLKTGYKIRH